jgi:hypothetical protein
MEENVSTQKYTPGMSAEPQPPVTTPYEPPTITPLGSVAELTLKIKKKRAGDFGNYRLS